MSAQVLREAAALMRTRAEEASFPAPPPWLVDGTEITTDDQEPIEPLCVATSGMHWQEAHAIRVHVASWHPAVALAVADWLDTAGADLWAHGPLCECGSGCYDCDDSLWQPHVRRAFAVARAYLGTTP